MNNQLNNRSQSGSLTLSEVVDEYLIQRMIDRKKYYDAYLTIAKRAWQKCFWNTLYEVQSVWLTMQAGTPYNYIPVPKDCVRIFSVNNVDRHGKIQPLFYNNQLNILPKPVTPSCGCNACKCDGLCDDLNAVTVTSKLLFNYSGVDYFQKCWIKTCSNGDVIKFCETPVKSYNDVTGTPGDYNQDYNNDYLIGTPGLDNFTIVTQTTQEKICALEVRPCGCVVDTPQNVELINSFCGCFFPFGFWTRHQHPKTFLDDINENHLGEVKLNEDNTRIYFKPTRHFPILNDPLVPQYLLLSYQTNGFDCTSQVIVPEFALDYMFTAIDYRSKRFNGKFTLNEKQMAKYDMQDEENKIIMFLNPLNLQKIADIQDAVIQY